MIQSKKKKAINCSVYWRCKSEKSNCFSLIWWWMAEEEVNNKKRNEPWKISDNQRLLYLFSFMKIPTANRETSFATTYGILLCKESRKEVYKVIVGVDSFLHYHLWDFSSIILIWLDVDRTFISSSLYWLWD